VVVAQDEQAGAEGIGLDHHPLALVGDDARVAVRWCVVCDRDAGDLGLGDRDASRVEGPARERVERRVLVVDDLLRPDDEGTR
jgi:hypothetical protein